MFRDLLQAKLAGICKLSPAQFDQLEAHYELLIRWNKTVNLTSIRKEEEIVERHYCESLFLGLHLPAGALRVADIGSGAGFPGIPVAIRRPDCEVTLIESHQRKAVFLKECARRLENVRVIARRAEDVQERFDWAISRAVNYADIAELLCRLAPAAALLPGETDLPGFYCVKLPWGERRYLCVSRETNPVRFT